MNTQRLIDKLTSWPVTLTVCLLIVLGTLTVKLWPRTVPFEQCSEIYKQYANVEGIDVSFIKDYKVNDTVFVDVTLLEATDSMGWATLKKDFEIPNPSPDFQQRIDSGKDLIYTKKIPKVTVADSLKKSHPNVSSQSREDDNLHSSRGAENVTYGNDWLAISHLNHIIIVFHTKNEDEVHAVIFRNFEKSINQDN